MGHSEHSLKSSDQLYVHFRNHRPVGQESGPSASRDLLTRTS